MPMAPTLLMSSGWVRSTVIMPKYYVDLAQFFFFSPLMAIGSMVYLNVFTANMVSVRGTPPTSPSAAASASRSQFAPWCYTYRSWPAISSDPPPTSAALACHACMKTGRANRWAIHEFEQEAKTGHLRFIDWLDFEEEFRKDFMPLNSEAAAINVLEMTAYFQGKWTVDDYLDQFRDLIYDSGYTNLKTIVVKFRWGLDGRISTALRGMTYGRPLDTDPEAWFRLAVRMDQNRVADEAFHVSHRQPYVPTPTANRPLAISRPVLAAPAACFAHSNPSLGNPVPMDIDVARKTKATPDTCRCCRKTGHWAKECNLRFDVRYMDTDKIERELENKFAAKDIASMETPDEVEPPVSVEDFVSCSRWAVRPHC